MPKVTLRAATLLASLIVLLLAAASGATVRVGVGMGGVRIGEMSEAVVKAIGKPKSIVRCAQQDQGGPCTSDYVYSTFRAGVFKGRVIYLYTLDKRQRTASGLGVGSRLAAVRRAYPWCKGSGRCEHQSGNTWTAFGVTGHGFVFGVYLWRQGPGLGCFNGC